MSHRGSSTSWHRLHFACADRAVSILIWLSPPAHGGFPSGHSLLPVHPVVSLLGHLILLNNKSGECSHSSFADVGIEAVGYFGTSWLNHHIFPCYTG